jgi:hypothetical protein
VQASYHRQLPGLSVAYEPPSAAKTPTCDKATSSYATFAACTISSIEGKLAAGP